MHDMYLNDFNRIYEGEIRMTYIKIIGESNSAVLDELKKLLPLYTEDNPAPADAVVGAHLIDFSDPRNRNKELPGDGRPVILMNTEMTASIPGCVATIPSKCSVLHFFDDYSVWQVLDVPVKEKSEQQNMAVTQSDNSICQHMGEVSKGYERPICPPSPAELAVLIEANIDTVKRIEISMAVEALREGYQDDFPTDLPEKQYKFQYVRNEWSDSIAGTAQRPVIAQLVELALIASFNPKCKYLRVRSLGAGFHPGAMLKNDNYDRGYFQSDLWTFLHCMDTRIVTYQTSPQNVSGATTYTTGSSFSVGVDISQSPSFQPSYTISTSETIVIRDFDVINQSAGTRSEWRMRMGAIGDSIWNLFEESFLRKPKVKPLPALATQNAQPHCEAVYRAEGAFSDEVPLTLGWRVDHYHLNVDGDFMAATKHYHHVWRYVGYFESNPWKINFALVSA